MARERGERMMKIVRVWTLLVVVMGVSLGGCETGESPRVHDVAPPSGTAVVTPPAPSSDTAARQSSARSSPKASMNRLMREMEGVSPSPEESGVAVRHPDGRPPSHASASGSTGPCPPAWFRRGESSGFRYGLGESAESRQSAEQEARLDVAKELEVAISGQDTVQARETANEGFEYSVESTIVERVNLSLTGISITEAVPCGRQWYARAALDQAKAAKAWREELDGIDGKDEEYLDQVKEYKQNKHAFEQMSAWYDLTIARETASQIEKRLGYLPTDKDKSESKSHRERAVVKAKDHYTKLLNSFKLVKKPSGENQRAVKQETLPEPFVVQVLAGTDPVAGVPVGFTVKGENIRVDASRGTTDKNGKVEVKGYYPSSLSRKEKDRPASIEAKVLLHEITNDYPDPLKQKVEGKQEALTATFHVQAPVFHLRNAAIRMANEAKELKGKIREHETKRNVPDVMKAMTELYKVQKDGKPVVERLLRLHSDSGKDVEALGAPEETRHALASVLGSLEVKRVSGDDQQAVEGPKLPEPFVVQVLAGTDPVAGVPVEFEVQKGNMTVPSSKKTDKHGKVEAEGRYPESLKNEGKAVIEAKVPLHEITKEYPDALKQAVEGKQNALTTTFVVKEPVFHLRDEALRKAGKAKELEGKIREHETKRNVPDVLGAMKAMAELYEVQKEGEKVVERLLRLHSDSGKDVEALRKPEETYHELDLLVSSFQFTLVEGDQQRAELDRPLNNPLKARLVAKLGENDVPVADVPVRFTFDQDSGTVEPRSVLTDEDGYVRAVVRRVEPGDGNHVDTFITASPDVSGQWLPKKFRDRLKENALRFRVTRPRGCVSADPFRGPLYKLVCDLVKGTNESVGKVTVVRGFVERTSGDRHPLSDRIEEALKDGLTLSKQVKVLEPLTPADAVPPRDPDAEVSGQYGADARSLWVHAKLSRIKTHLKTRWKETETVAEVAIPLNDVPRTGQSAFPSSAHDLPVVPDPSRFATHDEWVETFWTHRNPRAKFQTWIKSDKTRYQEGDLATFSFKTDRDCHLWVFAVDVKGLVNMLLPNYDHQDPLRVDAGKKITIPDPRGLFTIRPPFGTDRVKTVCTTRRIDVVASGHIGTLTKETPLFEFPRDKKGKAESLGGETLDPGEWSEAHTTVLTLPKGQTVTRGERGLQDLGLVSTDE